MKKKVLLAMMMIAVAVVLAGVGIAPAAWAETVPTSVLGGGNGVEVGTRGEGIFYILNIVLTVMTYGVGILATIGIVIAGYVYLTSKDDASKVMKAKERIVQIVIGLAIYAVIWSLLQFLLPGGLFGTAPTDDDTSGDGTSAEIIYRI